ncbi:hypothetical protein [Deinococcus peraridilitoris]|uniref:Uncharacterized protein n=1 Tax=Deinococcus peraridilitoris (strain DSM 19664 / LMG 22246 / CIP 109416 / KR-200) TaxID=937777 RepID=K9ZZ58_DEIPD|nr:hypothetical protein [Deinococcus peraridilitoris]AFZ66881.1 hypothetical protein Deipe_1332 [Deinococcus peraridilitoris DSM 19664]
MTDDPRRDEQPDEQTPTPELADLPVDRDHPIYHPPARAEATDRLDAAVDGTSVAHYGTNDPEKFEESGEQP